MADEIIEMLKSEYEHRLAMARLAGAKSQRYKILGLLRAEHQTWKRPMTFNYRSHLWSLIKRIGELDW